MAFEAQCASNADREYLLKQKIQIICMKSFKRKIGKL